MPLALYGLPLIALADSDAKNRLVEILKTQLAYTFSTYNDYDADL